MKYRHFLILAYGYGLCQMPMDNYFQVPKVCKYLLLISLLSKSLFSLAAVNAANTIII